MRDRSRTWSVRSAWTGALSSIISSACACTSPLTCPARIRLAQRLALLQLAEVARKLLDVRLRDLDVLQVGQVGEVDDGDDGQRRQHGVEADRLDEPCGRARGRRAGEVGHRSPEVV